MVGNSPLYVPRRPIIQELKPVQVIFALSTVLNVQGLLAIGISDQYSTYSTYTMVG